MAVAFCVRHHGVRPPTEALGHSPEVTYTANPALAHRPACGWRILCSCCRRRLRSRRWQGRRARSSWAAVPGLNARTQQCQLDVRAEVRVRDVAGPLRSRRWGVHVLWTRPRRGRSRHVPIASSCNSNRRSCQRVALVRCPDQSRASASPISNPAAMGVTWLGSRRAGDRWLRPAPPVTGVLVAGS